MVLKGVVVIVRVNVAATLKFIDYNVAMTFILIIIIIINGTEGSSDDSGG